MVYEKYMQIAMEKNKWKSCKHFYIIFFFYSSRGFSGTDTGGGLRRGTFPLIFATKILHIYVKLKALEALNYFTVSTPPPFQHPGSAPGFSLPS